MPTCNYVLSHIEGPDGTQLHLSAGAKGRDSAVHSDFQMLGLLFNLTDAWIAHDPKAISEANRFFTDSVLRNKYWDKQIAEELLSAPTLEIRMYTAWFFSSEWDREQAVKLDYGQFDNFWHNLEFCSAGWNGQFEHWEANWLTLNRAAPVLATAVWLASGAADTER